jgi:MoaA/NifB/PqqE/SkfB family radical SAM enzyme
MKRIARIIRTLLTRKLVLTFDKVDFVYERLSFKRLKNWLLAELSYCLKIGNPLAYPTHIQIEPSGLCNLRCPLCHIVTEEGSGGLLTMDNFKRIIDEVGEYALFLHFWGWGEPFINKDIYSMIRYAKDKGLKVISSTNGHFFDSQENVDCLIDSGLDALIFALDGADRQTYETYRREGDFDKALKGLLFLLERRRQRGCSLPLVNLRMLVTRNNEDQVPRVRQMAKDMGVDLFTLKTLCSFDNKAAWDSMVPCLAEYRRFEYDKNGVPIMIENPCKKPWNHPTVYYDGRVVLCDYHTRRELTMGNSFSNSTKAFWEVWSGQEFRNLRLRFAKKDRAGLRCNDCSLNYADVDRCTSHALRYERVR